MKATSLTAAETPLCRAIAIVLAAAATGLLIPGLGHAQSGAAASPGLPTSMLEEVIVTARKKSETVLSVPVSVTAFSAADLEKLNINSFTDYATKTPNMTF